MPDPGGEPDVDRRSDVSGELQDGPSAGPARPGTEPLGDAGQPGAVEPRRAVEALPADEGASDPPAEAGPTVDQGSRDAVEEMVDLNGDRTQAEPEDEMQLDRRGPTDPGGGKRRRGLFRRGGT